MFTRMIILLVLLLLTPMVATAQAQPPKPVIVARVTEEEIKSGQRVIGTVFPMKRSTIGSAVNGRVESLNVSKGNRVSKGDTLATLKTATLKIELEGANFELKLAKQRLAELKNGSRAEEIAEAEANMLSARAASQSASAKLNRIKDLVQTDAASDLELDDAQERADSAKFAFKATEALYLRVKIGPRPETIAQAETQVELQTQRAALINDRIKKCNIVAPFDGFVTIEFTEVGAWIQQGDPVVELIQMDPDIEVEAPVTADIAVNLRKGTVVRVDFPELPDQLLTGTIERIVPATTSRARTFPVYVRLKNKLIEETPMLLTGMLARIDFPAGKLKKLPMVPKDALVLNGNRRFVYVIDSSGGSDVIRKVDVDLGVASRDRIQVLGDIQVGQQVVVVGNERLVPDTPVKVIQEISSTDPRK